MTIVLLALICVIAVIMQDAVPGQAWYHTGAYALSLVAACSLLGWRSRVAFHRADARARPIVAVTVGALVVSAAGLAAGLLGPDTQTFVSAPGASTVLAEPPGTLYFPFDVAPLRNSVVLRFEGASGSEVTLPENGRRYFGGFVIWSVARSVAIVSVEDLHGRRLTITQPSGTSFLSPVLLFTHNSQIGGRTLPVDSFSIPAAQRMVKAVLFSAATLAQMHGQPQVPALLVAVEDERGHLPRGAIRLIPSAGRAAVGGVVIRAVITDYPQVIVAAAPYVPVLALGVATFCAGLIWLAALRSSLRS